MSISVKSVDKIRKTASRFYVVDLHMHSPMSYDWDNSKSKCNPRNVNLDRIKPGAPISEEAVLSYIEVASSTDRELIAITDHNVSAFAKQATTKNDSLNICILPGIELSVCFSETPLIKDARIHVLAIFPEQGSFDAFARIFPAGSKAEDNRDTEVPISYPTINELINKIHEEDGLAIAAHIESANGLRCVFKKETKLILDIKNGTEEEQRLFKNLCEEVKGELYKFDAIQVSSIDDAVHYINQEGELQVPLILSSDCHSEQEILENKSERYSYIKMAQPTFQALKCALDYPDVRIRFQANLPEAQPPRLLGLRIVGNKATEDTFFDDITLGFSDNLSCIIGPRGSGKSTIIDAIRYLFGYNQDLDKLHEVKEQVINRQNHTLQKSRIEALYLNMNNYIFKLVATYDPQENYVTEVFNLEGDKLNITKAGVSSEFKINLYGWGELELLAEKPYEQRDMLDQFIPDINLVKDNITVLFGDLKINREKCVEMANTMEAYFADPDLDFCRIDEFKKQFDELNTEDISKTFSKIDEIKTKILYIEKLQDTLQDSLNENNLLPSNKLSNMLEEHTFREDSIKYWADTLLDKINPEEIIDWMEDINNQYQIQIGDALSLIKAEYEALYKEQATAEKEIKSVVGDQEAITGDLRNKAKERYEKAKNNYDSYNERYNSFNNLLLERNEIISFIIDNNTRIYNARENEIERIREEISIVEDDNYKIDLELNRNADRVQYLAYLKTNITFPGHWNYKKKPEIIAANMLPWEFVQAIIIHNIDAMKNLSYHTAENEQFKLTAEDIKNILSENAPIIDIEGLDAKKVDPEKLNVLLLAEEVTIDDEYFVTLEGKAIQYCSPGQRCSAMLPLVALTAQAPLIIDQPEDNLDNRLVSKALYKIIARLKETRQLIVTTHNPNILVSGDSEQVLLLSPDGELERHGSIDDPDIIDSVLNLMEGGSTAFTRRLTKYDPYLQVRT